jgi:DNA-binding CsgD family transcriptional regulator
MPAPFARLDPSNPDTAAFLRDSRSLAVWEMLRRFGRATAVPDLAAACALPAGAVQAAVDSAVSLGVAERLGATRREPRIRYRTLGEQLVVVADHSDPALRALLSEGFAGAVAESRRTIDASMAESTKRWAGMQTLHQMISLSLEDAEARELMSLCEALRAFIDRTYERHSGAGGSAGAAPARCNYHLAIHLAPMHAEDLPSPRVQFVEKSTIAGLEKGQRARASRLLSPRERAVAALLVQGHTLKSVAKELGVSQSTVSTLCERIYRKLGIKRRAQLAMRLDALGEG